MIAIGDDKIYFLQNSTSWEIVPVQDDLMFGSWDELYHDLFVKLDGQKVRVAHSSNYKALKRFMMTAAVCVNKDMSLKEFLEQDFKRRYPDLVAKINLNYG